jgi:endonuclease YncB( thermonuclease family)
VKILDNGSMVINLPYFHGRIATARESIHDGDTLYGTTSGIVSIRFTGIDTPEVGYNLPSIEEDDQDDNQRDLNFEFHPIEDFVDYLTDPFDKKYVDSNNFLQALGEDIVHDHLRKVLNEKTALNHKFHADRAREKLIQLIEDDIGYFISSGKDFKFYIAFNHEILDRFGRFLGWIHKYEEIDRRDNKKKKRRNLSYNELMLKHGYAIPYFIWPNISPFRREYSIIQSLPDKENFRDCIEEDFRLRDARIFTKKARDKGIGIFESNNPLMLMPFELRFLADRYTGFFDESISCKNNENKISNQRSSKKPLHRYVIDLSKSEDPVLRKPDQYYKITIEDRLFVDEHFVPLFREKGYEIES